MDNINNRTDEVKTMTRYFEKTPIDFVEQNGEWGMTMEACGRGLGYADGGRSIHKIVDRNADEFEGLVGLVKLTNPSGKGGIQEVKILSRDAVNLVCMFSKQPRAKKMRKFYLKILREVQTRGYYYDNPPAQPSPSSLLLSGAKEKALVQAEKKLIQAHNEFERFYNEVIDELEEKLFQAKRIKARFNLSESNETKLLESGKNLQLRYTRKEEKADIELVKRNANIWEGRKRPDDLITIAHAFSRLYHRYGTISKIVKRTGCSHKKIKYYLGFLTLESEIIHLLETRQLDSYKFIITHLNRLPFDPSSDLFSQLRIDFATRYAQAKDRYERSKIITEIAILCEENK